MSLRCAGSFRLALDTAPVCHPSGRLRAMVVALSLAAFIGSSGPAEAKGRGKAAGAKSGSQSNEEIVSGHRVAVFVFEGEDTYGVRDHAAQALKDRGLTIDTSIRAADTAEQYRDMGAALNISVYLHGKVKMLPKDRSTATIVVRSAVSGQKISTVSFSGFRRGLPYDVEEKLWSKVGPAIARACLEANKPGRRHNKPTVIEAGTPL